MIDSEQAKQGAEVDEVRAAVGDGSEDLRLDGQGQSDEIWEELGETFEDSVADADADADADDAETEQRAEEVFEDDGGPAAPVVEPEEPRVAEPKRPAPEVNPSK
jgi:hypothetical protein